MVIREQRPGHGHRTRGGLWPGEGEPRDPETYQAALWRNLLGRLQSICGQEGKRGRASADHWQLSETLQAPSGHRLRDSNRVHSLPAGEGHLRMEGRVRPQGKGKGDSSSTT